MSDVKTKGPMLEESLRQGTHRRVLANSKDSQRRKILVYPKSPGSEIKGLRVFPLRCCGTKKEWIVNAFTFDFKRNDRNEGELWLERRR